MNLPSSMIVTSVIVAVTWFALVFQPDSVWAEAATSQHSDEQVDLPFVKKTGVVTAEHLVLEEAKTATVNPLPSVSVAVKPNVAGVPLPALSLQGVSAKIDLQPNQVTGLWTQFSERNDLHERLNHYRVSSYALYRNFDKYFSHGEVVIGYRSEDLSGAGQVVAKLPANRYIELLPAARFSAEKIAMG